MKGLNKYGDSLHTAYFDYKLRISKKYIYAFVVLAASINLLLLIPDLALIENAARRAAVLVIRAVYSVLLLYFRISFKKIKSFGTFSLIACGLEMMALAVFLYVFHAYEQPDLQIQSMGMITLLVMFFLFPNQWSYSLGIAILGSASFFLFAWFRLESLNTQEYWAAAAYVAVTILLCGIYSKYTEVRHFRDYVAKDRLETISTTDSLTNTANRYKMKEEAERWIHFCKRKNLPLSLVFVDVDNLKTINDAFGHSVGDSVLANLAGLMKSGLRSSDILARWGGDEFIILLPSISTSCAVALTERIQKTIEESMVIKGIKVTCSFGIAAMREDSTFFSLIDEADELMYKVKKQGKDSVQFTQ